MIKKLFLFLTLSLLFGSAFFSCRKEYSCEGCINGNKPPVANAGTDQVITLPIDSVSLDGRSSSDPDGAISSFLWSKISGPATFNINSNASSLTVIKNLVAGTYLFELKVTDNSGLSAKDTVMITVDAVATTNHPPIADAGPDQVIILPTNTVTINGSASTDADNNITFYQWTKISGPSSVNIVNTNFAQTQVTSLVEGAYLFELLVIDSGGLLAKDSVMITVDAVATTNHPPIADAGPDQVIILPTNTVTINGSASTDADNNIISYQWTKISGPSSFNISNQNAIQIQVTSLVEGIYQIELKVTDAGGLFSLDTIQITVNSAAACGSNRPTINVLPVLLGNLSKRRAGMAVASAGNKILFAGGYSDVSSSERWGSSRVDIYDITTNTWSTAELSAARYGIAAIAAGNKIFFAGGTSGEIGDISETYYSTVDIYNVTTNTWSVASLSEHMTDIAAATVGDKVFFAGGYGLKTFGNTTYYGQFSNAVDIYDFPTNSWSVTTLSQARTAISAVTLNNKVYFAGGQISFLANNFVSDKIDIYDRAANSWSVSTLSEAKSVGEGGIAINNKIYWAGGYNNLGALCSVEIKDAISNTTSFDHLSEPAGAKPVIKDNKIIYYRKYSADPTKLDIYDFNTNSWSIGLLNILRTDASIISVNNIIYLAGGTFNNYTNYSGAVYKLEF